jgi:hypothetical protein
MTHIFETCFGFIFTVTIMLEAKKSFSETVGRVVKEKHWIYAFIVGLAEFRGRTGTEF